MELKNAPNKVKTRITQKTEQFLNIFNKSKPNNQFHSRDITCFWPIIKIISYKDFILGHALLEYGPLNTVGNF